MYLEFEKLDDNIIIHNRGCGINYAQRRAKIPYGEVPENSWFFQEKLCDKIAIDISWSLLEPREGEYLWEQPEWEGCFNSWIDAGYKILLKVRGMDTLGTFYNQGTPQWVFDAGASYVDESIEAYRNSWLLNDIPADKQLPIRYPVYWDSIYLEKVNNLVTALGKRYNGQPAVESVAIAHMGRWGEMHIAEHQPLTPWLEKGYSLRTFLDAHKSIIDMYLNAFPNTQLQQSMGAPNFTDDNIYEGMESFDYLASKGVMIKCGGLGKSWRPSWSPYLDEDTMAIMNKCKENTKIVFENLVVPEALQLGLDMNMSYWQRGGEAPGLGILNVEKNIPIKEKKIYSMYNFFGSELDKLTIEDEKNIWRKLARKCGYRLSLKSIDIGKMSAGETFSTVTNWENSGSAACYEEFKIVLQLRDMNGAIAWESSARPSCGCGASQWNIAKVIETHDEWRLPAQLSSGKYMLYIGLKHDKFAQEYMQLANKLVSAAGLYKVCEITL